MFKAVKSIGEEGDPVSSGGEEIDKAILGVNIKDPIDEELSGSQLLDAIRFQVKCKASC